MDAELVRMLNHKIIWEKFQSRDGAGRATYQSPVELPCFLDGRIKVIPNSTGREVVSRMTIFLNGTPEAGQITADDRITLPDGTRPPIAAVQKIYDERGNLHHVEVYV